MSCINPNALKAKTPPAAYIESKNNSSKMDQLLASVFLTGDQVDTFIDENSAEIASFASKRPHQWLEFSRKVKIVLPANQDNTAIAARLDLLNGIAARLLKIESRFFTPFTQDALLQARSMPKELVHSIQNAIFLNLWSPASIHEAIERMKFLSPGHSEDTVVFGSIKVETFAAWVKEHKIQFKDLFLTLADRNTLLPHLEYLDLKEMDEDELEPILSRASSVQELKVILDWSLSKNVLAQLPTPKRLESLRVKSHHVAFDIYIEALSSFPNLKTLDISYCKIQDIQLSRRDRILPQFEKLETLILSGNFLYSGGSLEFFKYSTQLKSINLRGCNFTDQALESLHYFPKLETLILDKNSISDKALESIKSLEKLRELHLSETQITDAGLEKLKCLQHLTHLVLTLTNILGTGFANWESALAMKMLWLSGCFHFSNDGLKQIKSFRQLQELGIYDCKSLSQEEVTKFQEEMKIPKFTK